MIKDLTLILHFWDLPFFRIRSLLSPCCDIVEGFNKFGTSSTNAFFSKLSNMPSCLLVWVLWPESTVQFFHDYIMFVFCKISHSWINHEIDQIHQVNSLFSQLQVNSFKLIKEDFLVFMFAWCLLHELDHALADSDLWGIFFFSTWFFSEDKTKVNMEEPSILFNHQVFKMSVSDSEQISCNTVTSTRNNIVVHDLFELVFYLFIHFVKVCDTFLIIEGLEVILLGEPFSNFFFFSKNVGDCCRVRNEKKQAIIGGERNELVDRKFAVCASLA